MLALPPPKWLLEPTRVWPPVGQGSGSGHQATWHSAQVPTAFPSGLICSPSVLSLSEQEGAGVPQAPRGGLETHRAVGALGWGSRGRSRPSLPSRGCRQRGRCSRAEPVRDASAEMQSPSRGVPRPRPYLWPTSLPTEPPPRAGSSGLSPCGSSGAEAPAGAPPGPALPSDGERGSLARAILPERTAAAAAGGGRRAAGGRRRVGGRGAGATISARRPAFPAPPPQWNGRGGLGNWGRPGSLPPRPGGAQARPPPHPGGWVPRGRATWERVLAPQASRGCLTTEVVVIVMLTVTALGGGEG